MSERLDAELSRVTLDAFSMLGFMFPLDERPGGQPAAMADDALVVEVNFSGPIEGVVRLRAERQLVEALAANMTGEDEPPPQSQQVDALKEMLNVICGNILPAIDERAVFDVHAPQVGSWSNDPQEGDGAGRLCRLARCGVNLDGGQVEVELAAAGAVKVE